MNINVKPILNGVRILDFSRYISGPFCTTLLADLGAEVIKIEQPGVGDESRYWPPLTESKENSGFFIQNNRNKKSLTVNLKSELGKEIIEKLVKVSDVVVENFRPGVMDRLGFDYSKFKSLNSRIVYASISGFGQYGPHRDRPGADGAILAESGLMDNTGFEDGQPVRVGMALGDTVPGLYLALGICASLLQRDRTGEGQRVDVAMLDAIVSLYETHIVTYSMTGKVISRLGNMDRVSAPSGMFPTKDGYVAFGIGTIEHWRSLCKVIQRKDLIDDQRFKERDDRRANNAALTEILSDQLKIMTSQEIVEKLNREKIPVGPVNTIKQVVEHPSLNARKMFVEVDHPVSGKTKILSSPIRFSDFEIKPKPAPLLGQHNDEILADLLDYNENEIKRFRNEGVI